MAEGIGMRVHHHLGLVRSSGGKIHQHRILAVILPSAPLPRRCGSDSGFEILESFGDLGADADKPLEVGALGLRVGDFLQYVFISAADDGLDFGGFAAVDYIVCGKEEGGGNGHGSNFLESEHGGPEGEPALEYEHHEVATPYSEPAEISRDLVAFAFEIGETHAPFGLGVAGPYKCGLVRSLLGPDIHYVVCEIEMIGNIEFQFFPLLAEKSFQHIQFKFSAANIKKIRDLMHRPPTFLCVRH